ncbi:DUF6155 family protein [Roseivirga echinicomitans]|uniref:Uncharacterized protein n=1 Tax=Roseivirga echinicomitans TaxID=296218 RepID=A0A150X3A4_9BACT|nr:DUF6155 family protein [Roseivirga echinicomitans]KYG73196.1 hypothetical protein AWN68_10975 [Roseivirga echinicomitans]
MSKRALVKYLQTLKKDELETQVLELYDKFLPIRTYYSFVFNPKEDKLIEEAKKKVLKEYFPQTKRKAKARRSVAQKAIKHFSTLELDPSLLADFMLFNIETAMRFNARKEVRQEAFFKSVYNSFVEASEFVLRNGLKGIYWERLNRILDEAERQRWFNASAFELKLGEFSDLS